MAEELRDGEADSLGAGDEREGLVARDEPHGRDVPAGPDAHLHVLQRHEVLAYLAHPVFTLYARRGMVAVRDYAMRALLGLLGEPTVETEGLPSTGRVSLQDQPEKKRKVLHLLYAPTVKRGGIWDKDVEVVEDLVPLRGVRVAVRVGAPVRSVRLVPQGEALPFETGADGSVRFAVPELLCHQMVELA